jgi:hypothetical protein
MAQTAVNWVTWGSTSREIQSFALLAMSAVSISQAWSIV